MRSSAGFSRRSFKGDLGNGIPLTGAFERMTSPQRAALPTFSSNPPHARTHARTHARARTYTHGSNQGGVGRLVLKEAPFIEFACEEIPQIYWYPIS